jgi:hypothetical protein
MNFWNLTYALAIVGGSFSVLIFTWAWLESWRLQRKLKGIEAGLDHALTMYMLRHADKTSFQKRFSSTFGGYASRESGKSPALSRVIHDVISLSKNRVFFEQIRNIVAKTFRRKMLSEEEEESRSTNSRKDIYYAARFYAEAAMARLDEGQIEDAVRYRREANKRRAELDKTDHPLVNDDALVRRLGELQDAFEKERESTGSGAEAQDDGDA